MSLTFNSPQAPETEPGTLFLSASIPDPARWPGAFDAYEITDAVVAFGREFLTAGWRVVTAAHPTIAPLLLYLAGEIPADVERRVTTYQSRLFADVLPPASQRFAAEGIGVFHWTEEVEGDSPEVGRRERSLELMRRRMIGETEPDAALFIGGMEGIRDERALFEELRPGHRWYALGRPGGAAAEVAADNPVAALAAALADSGTYAPLARAVLSDLRPG
jgi:hypothetical protein